MTAHQLKIVMTWYSGEYGNEAAAILSEGFPADGWCVEQLDAFSVKNTVKLIHNSKGSLIGVLLYSTGKRICNICGLVIAPKYRRAGVGRYVIDSLTSQNGTKGFRQFVAHVRERQVTSQLFLKAVGFQFDPNQERRTYKVVRPTGDVEYEEYYTFTKR